jgi:amicyanin
MTRRRPAQVATKRKSRITGCRLAALCAAAGLGVAACSPSGAATHSGAASAPPNTAALSSAAAPISAAGKVTIANFAFAPAELTVKAGTKVTWTNNDIVAHTVTFTDVANSPVLNRGDMFSRTFTTPGTYSYICSIHPFMHGTVVVTA